MRKRTIIIIGILSVAGIVWIANYCISLNARGSVGETLRQAELLLVKQQPDQAIEKLNWLLNYDPANTKAAYLLGQCYYSQKDYLQALKHFQEVSPNSELYGDALLSVVKCCMQVAKMELAEETLKKYLVMHPDSIPARTELQWLYFNQFRLRELQILLDEGIDQVENPYPFLYHLLYMEIKPPIAQESIGLLKRINAAEPGQASILLALGYSYWKLGKIDQAKTLIEESRAIDPDRIESILVAADFYLESGELEKSQAILQPERKYSAQIQKQLEQDDRWHWLLSRLLFQEKKYDLALEAIQRALQINPFRLKYLQLCGNIHQAMGQHEAAQQFFQKTRKLALSRLELQKIVLGGELEQPTQAICLQIARYCEESGQERRAREWKKIAARIP